MGAHDDTIIVVTVYLADVVALLVADCVALVF